MPKREIRILLLVSKELVRKRLSAVMHDRYQLKTETNLESGLIVAYSSVPDIIIMQNDLPQNQLLLFCKRLKERQATSHIPIILILHHQPSPEQVSHFALITILPITFTQRELISALQQALWLKIQLMQRYPIFYNSDNAFVREQAYLGQFIKEFPE